ncbi:MAG: hypothetical protein ACLQVJ_10835 [Syntrophobacteraceae bacterium]
MDDLLLHTCGLWLIMDSPDEVEQILVAPFFSAIFTWNSKQQSRGYGGEQWGWRK